MTWKSEMEGGVGGRIQRKEIMYHFSWVQLLSHVRLFVIPWTAAGQASQSFTVSQSLLKLTSIKSVMPSSHLVLCHPLLLLPSIFPSIRVFPKESALCIRWPKYWSFSFTMVLPVNIQGWFPLELTGLILQSKELSRVFPRPSSNASILQCSAFFVV